MPHFDVSASPALQEPITVLWNETTYTVVKLTKDIMDKVMTYAKGIDRQEQIEQRQRDEGYIPTSEDKELAITAFENLAIQAGTLLGVEAETFNEATFPELVAITNFILQSVMASTEAAAARKKPNG